MTAKGLMIATKKLWIEAEGGGEIPAAYDDYVDDDYVDDGYVEAFSKRRPKHYPRPSDGLRYRI